MLLICSCYCIANAIAQAELAGDFVPAVLEQEPASGNPEVSPTAVVRVKFEDTDNQITKEKILLEVDRSDVTAFAQFADHVLIYQPQAPLQPGTHEVRISGTTVDGRKMREIVWSFIVPQPQTRSWQFGLEPSASFEYKVRKESTVPERHRFNSNISISSQRTGPLQTSFSSTLQAQDPLSSPVPSEFDLVNYKADFTAGSSLFSVGDVVVNYDTLSVANLARRGIFYQQKLPFLNSGFDFFSVRSEQIIGFRNGFGISDSDQRIDGGSFFFSPTRNAQDLILRFYYLRGENAKEQGFNFGGVTQGSKGNAFGVNLSSSLWSNQFRMEGFVAGSDFDFNGSDDFEGNKDHALLGRFVFDPAPRTWKNRPSKLTVQLEVQDLGLFFKSLGNPFLVSDRRGLNMNSIWMLGILGFTGGVSKFHDNVKGSNLLPSVDNLAYSAGFSVTPVATTGPSAWPSFNLTATRSEQESTGEAVSFLAVHSIVDNLATAVQLSRTKWNLGLNTSFAQNQDLNNRVPDTDSKTVGVTASLLPAPFWSLGPSINFTRQGNEDTDVNNDLWTYSFTGSIPLRPEKFVLDAQLSFSSTESSDQLNKSSNFSGTAQLSYHLHSLWKTPGRQTLAMRVSYNRAVTDAPFVSSQKGLEIFALLDLSWPFSVR